MKDKIIPSTDDVIFELLDTRKMHGTGQVGFLNLLKVYADNFIQIAQTNDRKAPRHLSRALLHRVHSVFLPPEVTGHLDQDPVSLKQFMDG